MTSLSFTDDDIEAQKLKLKGIHVQNPILLNVVLVLLSLGQWWSHLDAWVELGPYSSFNSHFFHWNECASVILSVPPKFLN